MQRILTLTAIAVLACYHGVTHANKVINLQPKERKVLNAPFSLNATCTVQVANQDKSKIQVEVVRNNCSVNGKNLASGQTTSFTVRNHSNITVSAEAGAEINLINKGAVNLQAVCSI